MISGHDESFRDHASLYVHLGCALILPHNCSHMRYFEKYHLTASALVTTPQNTTTIQCWRLSNPFLISTTSGIAGSRALALGNVTNLSYVIQPPRFDGGLHNAPVPQ
jgi:hypothetical protein